MRSRYEIAAQKSLEANGWLVDYKIRPRRPFKGYAVDYFGLFDLLAFKVGKPIRWIAIKGLTGGYAELRTKLKAFTMPTRGHVKELWRYTKQMKKPPKVEVIP